MDRRTQLKKIIQNNNELVDRLIDEVMFMEGQLEKS